MRLGIDIGGTFTDLLLVDDETGGVRIVKVLTTPADPSRGVVEAVDRALAEPNRALSEVSVLVHGTTLITNTIIERKGARTALLATEGHRDAVEIRREHRYEMYDVLVEMPKPLVPRHLRFGIDERISPQGEVLRPLDREQVERLVRRLQERGIEAIAVSFLHSYRNPVHELAVKEIVARVAPDLYVSLSSQVAPEIKEFERTSTTLCNAYVQARVEEYLGRLEDDLRERTFDGSFFLMQSSGGLCSTETARNFPVRVLESGPAGGALAASHFGQALGLNSLLSFDMGGTTAKLAVIDDGQPLVAPEFEVDRVYRFTLGSGLPVRVPTVEMIEIGAGGGSIARLDALSL
ncbi:MAG TPA: methylhydantoinase, partial [Chloroflexi bacterium]|nr:methylhydantoinase [Chloroflexota bacterium]